MEPLLETGGEGSAESERSHPDCNRVSVGQLRGWDTWMPESDDRKAFRPAQSQSSAPEAPGRESPIAIVGMACRFPGGSDLGGFWRLLKAGANAVTLGRPGSGHKAAVSHWGGFVEGIEDFDAEFFRIAPVEARLMDPQQRLLLETSWRALENAGIAPGSLRGSRTGVFAGIFSNDYRELIASSGKENATLYAATGNSDSTAIGRISYTLGLEGPAMAVDTASSSSLVAVHQAVACLQAREADLVLAGGVNAILAPALTEAFGDAGMLAADGRCKTFDSSADGYVRGEGCGVVVLKRLEEAEADGDRIWAVILGSAVNQDGASAGLTAPNPQAQQRVIEQALARAGLEPREVDYLEAHGTGTQLGDRTEVRAAAHAYGRGREAASPLLIGSVKTNIGHLEAAAGIAGLIKVALSINHQLIPRHLNFIEPNPRIDWHRLAVRVTAAAAPWPSRGGRPARAGVSSFGFSGTNAHVVVEEFRLPERHDTRLGSSDWNAGPVGPPMPMTLPGRESGSPGAGALEDRARKTRLLPLSARTDQALRDLARRYLAWLEATVPVSGRGDAESEDAPETYVDSLLADMAWTAGTGRSHFEHRAGLVFASANDLKRKLEEVAHSVRGTRVPGSSKLAFVFTGQGSQWAGMGRALYEAEPVARAVLDRCEQVCQEIRGASLLDVMFARKSPQGELDNTAWTQPALYALECAIAELWASVGIRADVVLGHSVGELAAARTAGAFGLEDGLRLACLRGELMARLPVDGPRAGAMAAVFASADVVASVVDEINRDLDGVGLSVAADNGSHRVVSGPVNAFESLTNRLRADGARVERLNTSHGFHSGLMEPVLDELETVADGIASVPPELPFVSNVTGRALAPGHALDGAYWRRHARKPVAFAKGVASLARLGVGVVMEIGPGPVLGPLVELCWPRVPSSSGAPAQGQQGVEDATSTPVVLASLGLAGEADCDPGVPASESGGRGSFAHSVAAVYEAGAGIAYEGLFAGEARRRISLPGYPFQRQNFWVEPPPLRRHEVHALLGVPRDSAAGEVTFETEMSARDPGWLGEYRVHGHVMAPAALQGALAIAAATDVFKTREIAVESMRLHKPMVFPKEPSAGEAGARSRTVQVVVGSSDRVEARVVRIFSSGGRDEPWLLHSESRVSRCPASLGVDTRADIEMLRSDLSPVDLSAFYDAPAKVGIECGQAFSSVRAVWSGEGVACGEIALPDESADRDEHLHPALLEACLQVLTAAQHVAGGDGPAAYLPLGWDRLRLASTVPRSVVCFATVRTSDPERGSAAGPDPALAGAYIPNGLPPHRLIADVVLYRADGVWLGDFSGLAVRGVTRTELLTAVGDASELLYELVWRQRRWDAGSRTADFLVSPELIGSSAEDGRNHLISEGVSTGQLSALQADLERLARSYAQAALKRLGWQPEAGSVLTLSELRRDLEVATAHARLLRRMVGMLVEDGLLAPVRDRSAWTVVSGDDGTSPKGSRDDPDGLAATLGERHPYGLNEIRLLARCGGVLEHVLRGRADPRDLLPGIGQRNAGDFYREALVMRVASKGLGQALADIVADLPANRRLRVLEIGAGSGGTTEFVLPELPAGRYDYVYTNASRASLSEAEARFGEDDWPVNCRLLDIEKDPSSQGFDEHAYDLVIAGHALHATRNLKATLQHCLWLLTPSGQLLVNGWLRSSGWLDLTFGLLDSWRRFSDADRSDSAVVGPTAWRQALASAGFREIAVLNADDALPGATEALALLIARAPAREAESPGTWVLAADGAGHAAALAESLAERNQTVVVAGSGDAPWGGASSATAARIVPVSMDLSSREAWRSLLNSLPSDQPLRSIVHLAALDNSVVTSTSADPAFGDTGSVRSALALVRAIEDAGIEPSQDLWLVTRGAQSPPKGQGCELLGSALWGLARFAALELPQVQARIVDLDPDESGLPAGLVDELLHPDRESNIAYRASSRYVVRLARSRVAGPLVGSPDAPVLEDLPSHGRRPLGLALHAPAGSEIRIDVLARGLALTDLARFEEAPGTDCPLAGEIVGRVTAVGTDVPGFAQGDLVAGFATGDFAAEAVMNADLATLAPEGIPPAGLATMPAAFVIAAIALDLAALEEGESVLVHASSAGVGQAAMQLAAAAGAQVFITSADPDRARLDARGLGFVIDRTDAGFAAAVLDATAGEGVDVALSGPREPASINESLACLKDGGRLVEAADEGDSSARETAIARPDVSYRAVSLDRLLAEDPRRVGSVLRQVMGQVSSGALAPLEHDAWPAAEFAAAPELLRGTGTARKIVLTWPPRQGRRLRDDRSYLVTGTLDGLVADLAGWLVDRGARTIILPGQTEHDDETTAFAALRERGAAIGFERADLTDADALEGTLKQIESALPPIGGVIHFVGSPSARRLSDEGWDRFDSVLSRELLGAWNLHRAMANRDLDLFALVACTDGVQGGAGLASFVTESAFLDQLALHRRGLGLVAQSVALGPCGSTPDEGEQPLRAGTPVLPRALRRITPEQVLLALDEIVRLDAATSLVALVDWTELAGADLPAILAEIITPAVPAVTDSRPTRLDLADQLRQAHDSEREGLLVSVLQGELQDLLGRPTRPEPTVGFFDLGLDSIMAKELTGRLNRMLSGELVVAGTAVFEHSNTLGLARHVTAGLGMLRQTPATPERRADVRHTDDSIAIVGMACRFPGGEDLSGFWRLLKAGASAVTEGRPDLRGRLAWNRSLSQDARSEPYEWGAFLRGIDRFDADFFRIAPVEARLMDPQQRLLLESTWQALEEAGIAPGSLRGSRTGVFAGVFTNDYRDLVAGRGKDAAGLHIAIGNSDSTAIGRIAYTLGLEGPAMAVDTACSSSLVAVHQAGACLQRGEADLALAGGVNAILSPILTEAFRDAGMLAGDGRCKTFDAEADGYVRGEGCGMVVLKRLPDAQADGNRIWGVIRGSAVNQDGASAGLTVPNGKAQERVIRDALERAGLDPSEVDYLEAHGTGTELGDPIEVRAAAAVYGQDRETEHPLLIGSVKTNIGHLESAAGIAGLIKVILAINHGEIPRHLNFRDPNPSVDWNQLPVRVTEAATPWPAGTAHPPRAAVSSFGFSGTNAHIVVEGHSELAVTPAADSDADSGPPSATREQQGMNAPRPRRTRILPLSGKSGEVVGELAQLYLSWLREGTERPASEGVDSGGADEFGVASTLADMAWTAGVGRSHFEYRAALVFDRLAELKQKLVALTEAGAAAEPRKPVKTAFVFTGQGSQWAGMGRELYETEPVARAVLDRCDQAVKAIRGQSLLDVMFGEAETAADLDDTAWTQPALYALQSALGALWASLGVRPVAVMGHSVGEIAAAHIAGAFGLEDGLRFAAARGAVMAELPVDGAGAGAMLAVFARRQRVSYEVAHANEGLEGAGLSLAADNGTHRVVSGPAHVVDALAKRLASQGVRVERLNTSHAFHSALVEPVLDRLEAALVGVATGPVRVPLVSNVTGKALSRTQALDGAYWRRHAREPVEFAQGVSTLQEMGADVVVEIGPRPVLAPLVEEAWPRVDGSEAAREMPAPVILASERAGSGGGSGFARAVATYYEAGGTIAFESLFAGESRRRVSLPTYPFQRERYWIDSARRRVAGAGHALLGERRDSASGELTFEAEMLASDPAWLADHRVFGLVLAPASLFGAMAAEALSQTLGPGVAVIENLRLHAPLVFTRTDQDSSGQSEARTLQVVVSRLESEPAIDVRIHSRGGPGEGWTLHAETLALHADGEIDRDGADPEAVKAGLATDRMDRFYADRAEEGLQYGPAFQVVTAIRSGRGEAMGEIALPPQVDRDGLHFHPAQLDGCLQVLAAAAKEQDARHCYLPVGWESLSLAGALPERVLCHAVVRERVAEGDPAVLAADLRLYGPDGAAVGVLKGVALRRATRARLLSTLERVGELLHEVVWREESRDAAALANDYEAEPPGAWVLVADGGGAAEDLAERLARRNQTVVVATLDGSVGERASDASGIVQASVQLDRREAWRSLIDSLPADVPLRGIVHLRALDGHGLGSSAQGLTQDLVRSGASALALAQGVLDSGAEPSGGLWFVTKGAQVLDGDRGGELAGAALWGLARSAGLEAPQLRMRMIDLDPRTARLPAGLADELLSPGRETQVAYRGGARRVARLVPSHAGPARTRYPENQGWRLACDAGESRDDLRAEPVWLDRLGLGEIRVAVGAAGLNFKDVLISMGLVATDSLLGSEMCGRVVEVGADVTTVRVGERVAGFAQGAFGPEVVTREELVAPVPAGVSAAAAATVPMTFVTAELAFELAGLGSGDRVLVHAAAGGVGQAAVQLAREAGATVFATASAPKWGHLQSQGVERVFDSRSTAFAGQILEATDGAGVEVVLNSLIGEGFIEASLACLERGGRFLELSKRDIWSAERMSEARPDVAYHVLEVDRLTADEPALVGATLRQLMSRVAKGALEPLAYSAWPLVQAGAAMEWMRVARHVGKIVLTAPPLGTGRLRANATYLVTGGLGGLGLEVAAWLADRGARTIVLNGRNEPDAAARDGIASLQERGVALRVELADVADEGAVEAMLGRIDLELPPLAGVIHSVAVLSDGALANQRWERYEHVLKPKVLGAWHLHRATEGRDLDLFVLFSSVVALLGNPGQSNYAAANAFLDQLARHRRALGLPGQSIAWGPWSGVGVTQKSGERVRRQLDSYGYGLISPTQGRRALDRIVLEDVETVAAVSIDWQGFAARIANPPPLLDELLVGTDAVAPTSRRDRSIVTQVRRAPAVDREGLMVSTLQRELQEVLRLPSPPDPAIGFFDLGMDSLMAVEFRNRITRALAGECTVSSTVVFDHSHLNALARHLLSRIDALVEAPVQPKIPGTKLTGEDRIAIVGMACRFPGAEDLTAFWQLLETGSDAVTEGRRPAASHTLESGALQMGAYVDGIDRFDAEFFRIAPVEARLLDPQQRLLLETSWEALEEAGIAPTDLNGSRSGVFAGITNSDYRELLARYEDAAGLYAATGSSYSTAIGRVAFTLGLEGPAMAVDTACSSSLVAVHQAVASLQRGEADLALAGGVNAILTPKLTETFAQGRDAGGGRAVQDV